jgi:uncharacterized protein (TIGR03435 family)
VKSKLGYTASWRQRDAEVLQLKVRTPNAPGLRVSANDTGGGSEYRAGKVQFRHAQLRWITGMMENTFNLPIEDETGLDGYYDFAIAWDWRNQRRGGDEESLRKSLAELGLVLVPATTSMQMMVVEVL